MDPSQNRYCSNCGRNLRDEDQCPKCPHAAKSTGGLTDQTEWLALNTAVRITGLTIGMLGILAIAILLIFWN